MALAPGTRIGPYEVTAHIGEGGMGQVYRATDTKLKRQVAVKILPPSLEADADRLARFQREAEVLASLNHPHIAGIYGIEESQGIQALMMEFVDGEDLAQRIAHGAIPISDAVPVAQQIALALEAAHEQSIIHRDLKPANIMLRPDGTVKVLDFGLAKVLEHTGMLATNDSELNSPTMTSPAITVRGVILGTAAYMAPEQARGKPLDKRVDIWAFGCVLYEMLTGRAAFKGEDVADTLAAVLTRDVDMSAVPAQTPEAVRRLLRQCLHKNPKERLRDIGDARLALGDAIAASTDLARAETSPRSGHHVSRRWVGSVAALGVAAIIAIAVWLMSPAPPSQPERAVTRFSLLIPRGEVANARADSGLEAGFSVSPDGRHVVFATPDSLSLRSLDQLDVKTVLKVQRAFFPFWSPDAKFIGFFAGGRLQFVDVDGSVVESLADAYPGGYSGGTWNRQGVIVFADGRGALRRVSPRGGTVEPVTELNAARRETAHAFPSFLPDGNRFLYAVESHDAEHAGVYVSSLDGMAPRRVLPHASTAHYAEPGFLLFAREATLMAQPVNPDTLEVRAHANALSGALERLGVYAPFSIGGNTLVFGGSGFWRKDLAWFDRTGRRLGEIAEQSMFYAPALSPDGATLAVDRSDPLKGGDIWLFDLARQVSVPLTTTASNECCPVWAPDGSHIVFLSQSRATHEIRRKFLDNGREEALYTTDAFAVEPSSMTPDGKSLAVTMTTASNRDIALLSLEGARALTPFLATSAAEMGARFSPDGRWIAYTSDETGSPEVFVQSVSQPGRDGESRPVAASTPYGLQRGRHSITFPKTIP